MTTAWSLAVLEQADAVPTNVITTAAVARDMHLGLPHSLLPGI